MAFIVEIGLLFNIVFVCIPLFGKLAIVQKTNFLLVEIYLGVIAALYLFNTIWVFFVHEGQFKIPT